MTTQERTVPEETQFRSKEDVESLASDFGETFFRYLLTTHPDQRSGLGAFISTYSAQARDEGVSGSVLVLSAMLGTLTDSQSEQLSQELVDLLNRYVEL